MARNMTLDAAAFEKAAAYNSPTLGYDRERDTLFVFLGGPRPAVSVDVNGEAWVRVIPETGEIVGLEIEDFESYFVKEHPEFAGLLRTAGPMVSTAPTPSMFERLVLWLRTVLPGGAPPRMSAQH